MLNIVQVMYMTYSAFSKGSKVGSSLESPKLVVCQIQSAILNNVISFIILFSSSTPEREIIDSIP
jgi:hypothetical protein